MFLLHPIDKSVYISIAHTNTAYVVVKRISTCLLQMPPSDEEITGTCEPNSIECKNEMVSHL
ncbi:hypothetical protein T12_15460 [Trichinella patagoniensis]|uniref:Uncharacterized protein n=1 Tax=Trichinella patagoniensis TaxID=990121 RepID=A0A0V1A3Z8_9BILA|nr:hypothetical protein T12_15460 [Trichinella patagoniensis]